MPLVNAVRNCPSHVISEILIGNASVDENEEIYVSYTIRMRHIRSLKHLVWPKDPKWRGTLALELSQNSVHVEPDICVDPWLPKPPSRCTERVYVAGRMGNTTWKSAREFSLEEIRNFPRVSTKLARVHANGYSSLHLWVRENLKPKENKEENNDESP